MAPQMRLAGVLLTGGASGRMGFDKATMLIEGVPSARRLGAELATVATPALEVGPGVSGLHSVLEAGDRPGPLVAFAAGLAELERLGSFGAVLLFACDLPFADRRVMELLATWPDPGSVVPLVDGCAQPLAARWSAEHTKLVPELVRSGEQSMRALLDRSDAYLLAEKDWAGRVPARSFFDVDTVADLDRLGVPWSAGSVSHDSRRGG